MAGTATAGVSTDWTASRRPGDTVTIEAVYFNEGNARATREAPPELVLQWRARTARSCSLARLQGGQARQRAGEQLRAPGLVGRGARQRAGCRPFPSRASPP